MQNFHQKKYEVNNPEVGSLSLTGPVAEDKKYILGPRNQIFGDNDKGCCVAMTGISNW